MADKNFFWVKASEKKTTKTVDLHDCRCVCRITTLLKKSCEELLCVVFLVNRWNFVDEKLFFKGVKKFPYIEKKIKKLSACLMWRASFHKLWIYCKDRDREWGRENEWKRKADATITFSKQHPIYTPIFFFLLDLFCYYFSPLLSPTTHCPLQFFCWITSSFNF